MAKRLEVERLDGLNFRIREQTHRGLDFGSNSCAFVSSGGFVLCSACCPYASCISDELYVRGGSVEQDDTVLTAQSDGWMRRMLDAVDEYNVTFDGAVSTDAVPRGPRERLIELSSRSDSLHAARESVGSELDHVDGLLHEEATRLVKEFSSRLEELLKEFGIELSVGVYDGECDIYAKLLGPEIVRKVREVEVDFNKA